MKIKFKDGHVIKFKRFGNIWLAKSVILERVGMVASHNILCKTKDNIAKWFSENAPEEIRTKYNARLPLWEEIKPLPLRHQVVYGEGKRRKIAKYFLGDEDCYRTSCAVHVFSSRHCSLFSNEFTIWASLPTVRLCLEEKK